MPAWTRHERIGDCDLYLGDCLDVVPEVFRGGGALLTDPPYGIDYGRQGSFLASHGWN
jgi:hypothetical protein